MSHIKRNTPLRVVEDIEYESMFYEAMGAERMATDSPQCIGYRAANDTGIILSSLRTATASFGPFVAGMLAQSGAMYLHVPDIDAHMNKMPEAKFIARNRAHGLEEAVVETDGNLVLLVTAMEAADA